MVANYPFLLKKFKYMNPNAKVENVRTNSVTIKSTLIHKKASNLTLEELKGCHVVKNARKSLNLLIS